MAAILPPGTVIAKVQEVLLKAGRPLHISAILQALGRPNDKPNRSAVVGSLGAYVRKGEIFKKAGPNVFALMEMETESSPEEIEQEEMDEAIRRHAATLRLTN